MKTLTKAQILKLRPEFKLHPDGMRVVEWFEIHKGASYYITNSGLRHADGKTKSPFYYEQNIPGKNTKKKALEAFTMFWNYVNSQPYNAVMTFPTKYELGFVEEEIEELCNALRVSREAFGKKFGTNTCAMIDNKTIMYHSDVLRTFRLTMNDREMTSLEFD
jgi:hypothetical protein